MFDGCSRNVESIVAGRRHAYGARDAVDITRIRRRMATRTVAAGIASVAAFDPGRVRYRARAVDGNTRIRRRMATRTVAGGRARSARPPESASVAAFDPGRGHVPCSPCRRHIPACTFTSCSARKDVFR